MNIPGAFTSVANLYHDNVARMALKLEEVAGFATLSFGPLPKGGATPTGIPNAATAYAASVSVDGTPVALSYNGNTVQTFTSLVAAMAATLTAVATVELVGGDIVITSKTTGALSTVVVTDTDLFSRVNGNDYGLKSNRSTKGHVKYLDWNKMAAAEQAELLTIMTAVDTTETNWSFATDSIRVTDDVATGINPLAAMLVAAGNYDLNVTLDGVGPTNITFAVTAGMNFQQMMDDSFLPALQAAFPGAKAYLTQVNATNMDITVESSVAGSTGAATLAAGTSADFIAAVNDTNWNCAAQAGVAGVDGVSTLDVDGTANPGVAYVTSDVAVAAGDTAILLASAGTYYFKVAVDGGAAVEYSIATVGDTTYTALAALLDAATGLDAAGVDVTFDDAGNRFVFTRKTTGLTSTVAVTAGTTGTDVFAQVVTDGAPTTMTASAVAGTTGGTWMTRINEVKSLNGFPLLDQVGTVPLFERENKPTAKGRSFNDGAYKYYDSDVDGQWEYYDTDAAV